MARKKQIHTPALPSIQALEDEYVALSYQEGIKRLMDGTATSEMIVYGLKLGSTRNILEKEKLASDTAVSSAKAENIKAAAKNEVDYQRAMEVFSEYHKGVLE